MDHIKDLEDILASPKRIAITMHQKPDGDAIGSSLGLYHYLVKKGHNVKVVSPTDYAEHLKWMPGSKRVIIGPYDPDRAKWAFDGVDIIFCLDFNAMHRLKDFQGAVKDSTATKIMIDHHPDPEGFEDFGFLDTTASSTAELVYRIIDALGDREMINKDMADPLYAGIMTDTGSFRFTNTSSAVHRIVAHLIDAGVDVNQVHESIYSSYRAGKLSFLGHCLLNCLTVLPEYKTAFIKLEKEVFKTFNVKSGETEGLVNYALGIKGINLGVLLTAHDNIIKMSFRSRGEVSSNEIAGEFGGGGHFYAAGGKSKLSMEETEARLISLLEERKSILVS